MNIPRNLSLTTGILALWWGALQTQATTAFSTLVSFDGTNGANPSGALVQSADGNFYGTASAGGAYEIGTVFQMTPAGALGWVFSFNGTNGSGPRAGLVQGSDGLLYGTTYSGGASNYGTIFKIRTNGSLTTLVSFANTNGAYPIAGLVQGSDGSFYGTTAIGGAHLAGTVFRMLSNGSLTLLVSFDYSGVGGNSPYAGVVQGPDGDFYGTTYQGGTNGFGTAFSMTPAGTLSPLHSFTGAGDGANPYAGLLSGQDGKFYGATYFGGASNYGTIFRMASNGSLNTLVSFSGTNGAFPPAGLWQAADGSCYGVTERGGTYTDLSGSGLGTLFKVTTNGMLTTLFSFANTNGAHPQAGLLQGADGSFYGTTAEGGTWGYGTIFRFSLAAPPPLFQSITPAGSTVMLTWTATAGQSYQMTYKEDLEGSSWSNVGLPILATNSTVTAPYSAGPGPQRFYRVLMLP